MLKNKIAFLFLILTAIFISVSCMRKVEESSLVSISLPVGVGSSKITSFENSKPMTFQNVSTQSEDDDGPDWNPVLNPTALSEINCYMIAINGPESDMRRNICTTTTGQNFFVGRWRGAIPAGGVLNMEVPSGQGREIIVMGFKAQNATACTDFRQSDVDSSLLSEPHIIGKVTRDLNPGPVSVDIPISLTGATVMDDCQGPDFQFGDGPSLFFGDAGPSHSATVVSANSDITGAPFSGQMLGAYSRVLNINSVSSTNKITVGIHASPSYLNFQPGSEVMLMIMGGSGGFRTPSHTDYQNYSSCGYKAWNGRFGFARVLSSAGTTLDLTRGTFFDSIATDLDNDADTDSNDRSMLAGRLSSAPNSANFCYIQMIKVPHFYNLTISSAGEVTAPPFDYSDNGGGVLAFRVSNELTMGSSFPLKMIDNGYRGRLGYIGDGFMNGQMTTCSAGSLGSGGGCGSSAPESGGGGGHGNQDAMSPFGPSGGNGYTGSGTISGGYGQGENCGDGSCFGNLDYKMYLGGAGGGANSPSSTGGHGGGIIYASAKTINLIGVVAIKASAITPSASKAGGGAGGTVNMSYRNISDKNNLQIFAYGANGGTDGTYGAGGGAGGRVQIRACKASGISQSPPMVNFTVSGGASGAAPNTGSAGATGTIVKYDVDCP